MTYMDELYKQAAEVIRSAVAKEKSIRTGVYASSYKNKKALLRMSCEALRFKDVFDGILSDKILKKMLKEPLINDNLPLMYVLLYEYLIGSGLNRASPKIKGIILKNGKEIKDQAKILEEEGKGIESIKAKTSESNVKINIPRYARINTLKWTYDEAIQTLKDENWKIIKLDEKDDFAKAVSNLKEDEVIIDPNVENLLIFPHHNEFHTYWMIADKYLILQDKASCLPAFLLNPEKNTEVFDCCAAPGMKTSHASAILQRTGKVWAVDRAEDRVETMKALLTAIGAENTEVLFGDFLKLNILDKRFSKVKYAIVDPPCSGSGIVKRMDELTGGNKDQSRLDKLKNLQAMILKHAMKFPNVQRVVYSTCSINEDENEQVVDEVLLDTYVRQNFKLCANVLPSWKYRGFEDKYPDIGKHCLRADPQKTLTNGFFVAVFERIN